jgi:hypothetical protein
VLALLTFAAGSYYMRQKLENEIQLQIDELSDADYIESARLNEEQQSAEQVLLIDCAIHRLGTLY